MANPNHCSVLNDRQMIINGIILRDKMEMTNSLNDGTVSIKCHLSQTRVIGDRSYTAKMIITEDDGPDFGKVKEEVIETDMDDIELENFKDEWDEKWNRSIRDNEPNILTQFFQMINRYAN